MLDHLVYGTPDLAATTADLAAAGLTLSPGGPHVGLGTRNALAALGDGAYLEVIGPDPEQPEPDGDRPFAVDRLIEPRLLTWAIRVDDLDVAVSTAIEIGYDPGPIAAMSRRRTDGVVLNWRLTPADLVEGHGVVPFLIDWADSEHPSRTAGAGARLLAFAASHPAPELVRRRLAALDTHLDLDEGPAELRATIATKAGEVVLR